jgi:hypothetical protein
MAIQKFKVTSYRVILTAPPLNSPATVAHIDCIVDTQTEAGVTSSSVMQIHFLALGNVPPPNGPTYISATADQLVWYLDLLRNERHVFAFVDEDDPASNQLQSAGNVGWGHIPEDG